MSSPDPAGGNPARSDASGPLLAVCAGHRCAGLRKLAGEGLGGDGAFTALRQAIKDSRGGVLISASCMGSCAQAPIAALGHRRADSFAASVMVWLGGLSEPARVEALADYVRAGGIGDVVESTVERRGVPFSVAARRDAVTRLPEALASAVLGVSGPAGTPSGHDNHNQ